MSHFYFSFQWVKEERKKTEHEIKKSINVLNFFVTYYFLFPFFQNRAAVDDDTAESSSDEDQLLAEEGYKYVPDSQKHVESSSE